MGLAGILLSSLTPEDALKIIAEYAPVIEATINFVERQKDDRLRALSMNQLTKALHYAAQTGDPTEAARAIRDHCSSSGGCTFP